MRSDGVRSNSMNLHELLSSWLVHLKAERKSPETLKSYSRGVGAFLDWCAANGAAPYLDRATVNAWTAHLLDTGAEPSTVRARQLAVRRFSAWLADEGEIDTDQLVRLRPPRLEHKITPELSDDQIKTLIKACSGRRLVDRRDEAIVRFMIETGARIGEVVALRLGDVDLSGSAILHKTKSGRARTVPFSPQTARAVDRYLRLRRGHRLADTEALWLGAQGRGLGYDGAYSALKARAEVAGIENFNPHLMRHTAAARWLAAGGSEGGLMAVAGWSRRDMLDRYTRASTEKRAAEEARRLGLGDLG